jgi:anti-anti-sigma regulatory factor
MEKCWSRLATWHTACLWVMCHPSGKRSMLRLTRTAIHTDRVLLKAEGSLVGEWVGLLEEECAELCGPERQVVLDLGDVSYLDRRAVRLLRDLQAGCLSIVNCPPLIEELLREDAP